MKRHATVLLGILCISVPWASAATKSPLTIKVISANTELTPLHDENNGAPKDCSNMDYSAYCHHSRNAIVRHTMVVQDSNGKTYTIACAVDTISSKCVSLPVGGVFSVEQIKRGIRVWYPNAKGKEVKQTYALPADEVRPGTPAAEEESLPAVPANSAGTPATAAVLQSSTAQSSTAVRFTSTPAGAEIRVDGNYVGNTPSTIEVGPGRHFVVLALPGFSKWKRELLVSSGSDVTLTATLQKNRH
ncbi:MAG: PEGA domain-containing protein [Terriglobales bacterium]